MDKLIACCGLDCMSCQARIATKNNDDELRIKVADEWSKLNGVLITKEMINCDGCRLDGVKTPFCDKLCPIRQCVINRKLDFCGDCSDLDSCETIKMIISNNNDAYNRLKKINYRIYSFLTIIPKGKVVTYGQIAEYLGNKNYARIVGNILHNNPDKDRYPCYKVVDCKGNLSNNYAFGGIDMQKKLLEADGIIVDNYRVDLEKYKMK